MNITNNIVFVDFCSLCGIIAGSRGRTSSDPGIALFCRWRYTRGHEQNLFPSMLHCPRANYRLTGPVGVRVFRARTATPIRELR